MPGTSAATASRGAGAHGVAGWAPPLVIYGAVLAILLVVSWRTNAALGSQGPAPYAGSWFWDGWVRFDGGWYRGIAINGYSYVPGQQSSVVFFPGYPTAMRAVGDVLDNVTLGGIAVTIASAASAMVLYWRWCVARLDRRAAVVALCCLALYPYAWYLYGAVYGDALFLVLVLASFTLFERGHLWLAGVVGAAATATRFVGVALVAALVVGVLEQRGALQGEWRWGLPRRLDARKVRASDAGVLLSIGGLVAWSAWLWRRFGDPLLFSSVQEEWGQPSSPETWLKADFFYQLLRGSDRVYAYGVLAQGLAACGALLLAPAVHRAFGLRYAVYTVILIAIPAIGSQDFQGLGRYLIGAFPVFAVVGSHLAGRPRRLLVLPVSAALLVMGTIGFADGRYLA